MKCPFCGEEDTRVLDSRAADDNTSIRRRRQCTICKKRFTTYERAETIQLNVVKKDLNREPYNRSKIEAGIIRSCHKRPISSVQICQVVDEIEGELYNRDEREVTTDIIGELVMKKLKDLDPVAYVRFASVYREFKDAATFMDELKTIIEHSK